MEQRILVFRGQQDAVLEKRTVPPLQEGEFRVRTTHSLISPGTELALYRRTHIGFDDPEVTWCTYPLDIGYASVGIVEESADGKIPVGTRVTHYGPHADVVVLGPNGPVWAPVPERLSSTAACFGRFAQIAYSSVVAAPRPPKNVLVYGAGIVGNLAAQWFRESDAATTITDTSAPRLEIARECGIERTILAGTKPTESDAPDTIVEATGVAPVVNQALDRVAVGGQVVLLGSIRHEITINAYKKIHRKAVLLSGAHETILGTDRTPTLINSLDALADGRIHVASIVTKRISPTELAGVYDKLIHDPVGYFGVVVEWDKE